MFISRIRFKELEKRIADLERQVQESSCSFYAERSMDMFESKKRFKELEKRIADLERQVQGQQKETISFADKDGILKSISTVKASEITFSVQ